MEYTHGVYVWCMCEDCEPWSRDCRHSDHRAPSCMICSYTRLHTRKMPDDPELLLFLFCQLFSHLATTASNIAARCATNKYGITSQFIYDNNISFSTLTGLREHISQQSISCTRSGGGRSAWNIVAVRRLSVAPPPPSVRPISLSAAQLGKTVYVLLRLSRRKRCVWCSWHCTILGITGRCTSFFLASRVAFLCWTCNQISTHQAMLLLLRTSGRVRIMCVCVPVLSAPRCF